MLTAFFLFIGLFAFTLAVKHLGGILHSAIVMGLPGIITLGIMMFVLWIYSVSDLSMLNSILAICVAPMLIILYGAVRARL